MIRVFVSHASEDKESFVRELAEALDRRHLKVWYDEFSLKLGDSLLASIDRGLAECHFGIVVLSPAFFAKKWAKDELDGLFSREVVEKRNLIIPIWHGVGFADVASHSPILASRLAADSSNGVAAIVAQITSTLKSRIEDMEARHFTLRSPYGGEVSLFTRSNPTGEFTCFDKASIDKIFDEAKLAAEALLKKSKT